LPASLRILSLRCFHLYWHASQVSCKHSSPCSWFSHSITENKIPERLILGRKLDGCCAHNIIAGLELVDCCHRESDGRVRNGAWAGPHLDPRRHQQSGERVSCSKQPVRGEQMFKRAVDGFQKSLGQNILHSESYERLGAAQSGGRQKDLWECHSCCINRAEKSTQIMAENQGSEIQSYHRRCRA
jgi:hypothetical protein